jgi:hypothetical protein
MESPPGSATPVTPAYVVKGPVDMVKTATSSKQRQRNTGFWSDEERPDQKFHAPAREGAGWSNKLPPARVTLRARSALQLLLSTLLQTDKTIDYYRPLDSVLGRILSWPGSNIKRLSGPTDKAALLRLCRGRRSGRGQRFCRGTSKRTTFSLELWNMRSLLLQ